MKGYKITWQTADGAQYTTDYVIETKKKAEAIADRILSNMNSINCVAGQGAWVIKA
jgi:hypothetical protein